MVQWKCRCLKSFECWVWKSFEAKAFKTSARVHGYPESYVTVTVIRTPSVLEAPQLQAWLGSMKMSGAPLGTRYSGLQSWYGLMRLFEAWSIQDEIFFHIECWCVFFEQNGNWSNCLEDWARVEPIPAGKPRPSTTAALGIAAAPFSHLASEHRRPVRPATFWCLPFSCRCF